MARILVLGAGFTAARVVVRLCNEGADVVWTQRQPTGGAIGFDLIRDNATALLRWIESSTTVLHSIPTLRTPGGLREATPTLCQLFESHPPSRIVYLSTTGVYGAANFVDEHTLPAPRTERESLRVQAEAAVLNGPWQSLVLRPAAIYGPGRGIHRAMQEGEFRLPENPSNYVSRIHVDDLSEHAYAALWSDVEGAYPVADERPCTSLEAAQFCANLLKIPLPPAAPPEELGETRRADRRVDGSAIRRLLGIRLRYPDYKSGFPACLESEARKRPIS